MSIALGFVFSMLIMACGSGASGEGDPVAKLNQLKEQRAALESEIATLEQQLIEEGVLEKKLRTVAISEVQPTAFRHFIDLQGKVEAEDNVMATAQMPGTLKRVLVKNGSVVQKGQLLAEIDDAVILKSMAEIEGQLHVAKDLYERQKSLWEQNIGSEVQYIQAKNNMESLERSLATLKENHNMARITAPTSGTVDMVLLKVGQAISPGVPLCQILNLTDLKVVGQVTEAYAAKVKRGDKVQVFFPDTKEEITTTVSYVSKIINPNTRTFTVECNLGRGEYRANQIAVLKIVDYQNPQAITVPVNVIQSAEGEDFILTAEKTGNGQEAIVKKATVKQGQTYNGMVEILEGLKPGDLVVSTGFQDVNLGETVLF